MPPPTQSFHNSSLANALQPTSSVLPPNNPHANSIHYPGAGHYPMDRTYSMPQVGGGGPPTPAPLQQQYYTPQMPLLPRNHSFTFTQSTLQNTQRHDIQQLRQPGNDQRPTNAQYQPTSHLNVYRPQMPPPPQNLNAQYNHHMQQLLPQTVRPPNAQYQANFPNPFHHNASRPQMMPPPPQNIGTQYNYLSQQSRPGNDQRAPHAQYQHPFPANVNPSQHNAYLPHAQRDNGQSFAHSQSAHAQLPRTQSLPAQYMNSNPTHQTRAPTAFHPHPNAHNTSRTTFQSPARVDERSMSFSVPSRSATSSSTSANYAAHQSVAASPITGNSSQSTRPTSLQGYQFTPPAPPSSTSNYAAHQAVFANNPAQSTGPTSLQGYQSTPPTRPLTSNAPVHPPRQFAAPSAPVPVRRAVAPVGPSPLQRSMTTPGPVSANPYAHLLPMGQKQTQIAEPVNASRPVPQLRRSTTEPTVGKRKYAADEEERQAKKAKYTVSRSDMAPEPVQAAHPLQTIEEIGESQLTGLYENKKSAALPEPKLVHGDVVPGCSPMHSTQSTVNDSRAKRRLNILKALSAEQVKRLIEKMNHMKKNGLWPPNGSTTHPYPAQMGDKVIGDNRARSVDDEVLTLPGPVRDKRNGEQEDDVDRSGDDEEPEHNKEGKERELESLFDEFVNPDAFD
ncbi:hypothetical protein CPB85DRAFT_603795 [Mucidula mucida]|nr:hypothetical protein CPB85DRAFT_603795 [Mucidula mucida]